MAMKYADLVRQYSTITGTGPVAFSGTVVGFRSFASQLITGETFYYVIQNLDKPAEVETGIGTWLSNGTFARNPAPASPTNFTSGKKAVALTVGAAWYRALDLIPALESANAASIVSLLSSTTGLSSRVTALEARATAAESRLTADDGRLATDDTTIATLTGQVTTLQSQVSALIAGEAGEIGGSTPPPPPPPPPPPAPPGAPTNTVTPSVATIPIVGQFTELLSLGTWTNSPTSFTVKLYDGSTVVETFDPITSIDAVTAHQFLDIEVGDQFKYGIIAHNVAGDSAEIFTSLTAAVTQINLTGQITLTRDSASGAAFNWHITLGDRVFPGYDTRFLVFNDSAGLEGTQVQEITHVLTVDDFTPGTDWKALLAAEGLTTVGDTQYLKVQLMARSPNGNPFVANSGLISPTDVVIPLIWNPSDKAAVGLANSNLTTFGGAGGIRANIGFSSGKKYFEFISGPTPEVCLYNETASLTVDQQSTANGGTPSANAVVYAGNNNHINYNTTGFDCTPFGGAMFTASVAGNTMTVSLVNLGTIAIGQYVAIPGVPWGTTITAGSGTTWTLSGAGWTVASVANCLSGPIIGMAVDKTADLIWYAVDNTWQNSGVPASGTNGLSIAGIGSPVHAAAFFSGGGQGLAINGASGPSVFSSPAGFTFVS